MRFAEFGILLNCGETVSGELKSRSASLGEALRQCIDERDVAIVS